MGQLVYEEPAPTAVQMMVEQAVERAGEDADNTSVAVIRMDPVVAQDVELRVAAIKAMQDLVAVCRDSCLALREAIDKIEDRNLQSTFKEMLTKRTAVRDNLIAGLSVLGAGPDENGTVAGATIRVLSKLKTVVLKNDQMAVINALEAAEDRVKNKFLDTLKLRLPVDAQNCIQKELSAVFASHDLVSALKHANQ